MQRFAARPVATRVRREGRWVELSYRELAERVQAASLGLRELGLADGDRVAILSENRPEWAITDFACLTARCTDVPIYPTLPARQVDYVLRDSGAVAVLVSSVTSSRSAGYRAQLPALRHVIAFDADARPRRAAVRRPCRLRALGGGAPPRLADPRAFGLAGRPRDAHLYLGHDGRSQGRDADARQHRIERDHLRVAVPLRRGRRVLCSCPCRTSSSECSATTRCSTPAYDQLRRQHRHRGGRHAGSATDHDGVGAAIVREDLFTGAGQCAGRLRVAAPDLRVGAPRG